MGLTGRPTGAESGTPADDRVVARLVSVLARPGAGLLLDLDGTLVDSEPVHQAAFAEYFRSRGWTVPKAVVRSFSGRRAQEVFGSTAGPWGDEDPEALTQAVIAVLRRTATAPAPVRGAVELLAACRATSLPVAVVTSARWEWAAAAVSALGSPALPMVTAELCTRGKPDPEPYVRGTGLLGLAAPDVLAAEDAPAGLQSALGAGLGHVLAVTTSHPAELLGAAHTVVADLRPLALAVRARASAPPG